VNQELSIFNVPTCLSGASVVGCSSTWSNTVIRYCVSNVRLQLKSKSWFFFSCDLLLLSLVFSYLFVPQGQVTSRNLVGVRAKRRNVVRMIACVCGMQLAVAWIEVELQHKLFIKWWHLIELSNVKILSLCYQEINSHCFHFKSHRCLNHCSCYNCHDPSSVNVQLRWCSKTVWLLQQRAQSLL